MEIIDEIKDIINEFSLQNEIQGITIGGSMAAGKIDTKSDYDIYIYLEGELEQNIRENILSKYSKCLEIGNSYWELEDNMILSNGIFVDIIYRNLKHFINEIIDIIENGNSRNGYTTCLWHNLMTSEIMFDKYDKLKKAKERFLVPFPQELKRNIIKRNLNLICDSLVSYDKQIEKSIYRHDLININNRITAFLDSYFDIIFAINELPHSGEKRIINICLEKCKILPNDFENNINKLLNSLYDNSETIELIRVMVNEIKTIVKRSNVE